jgi:hypothetical protein
MTWHVVTIAGRPNTLHDEVNLMWECRNWCRDNLSSEGVLWKYEWNYTGGEFLKFMFAQPGDAVLFRLVHSL